MTKLNVVSCALFSRLDANLLGMNMSSVLMFSVNNECEHIRLQPKNINVSIGNTQGDSE